MTRWYLVREIALLLHRSQKTIRRHLKPHRAFCRLGRDGQHPRRVLYVPQEVVDSIEKTVLPPLRSSRNTPPKKNK